jgi:hypothetical protein
MLTMVRQLTVGKAQPLQEPFNLVINLALGGAWSGHIDDAAWKWRPEPGVPKPSARRDISLGAMRFKPTGIRPLPQRAERERIRVT